MQAITIYNLKKHEKILLVILHQDSNSWYAFRNLPIFSRIYYPRTHDILLYSSKENCKHKNNGILFQILRLYKIGLYTKSYTTIHNLHKIILSFGHGPTSNALQQQLPALAYVRYVLVYTFPSFASLAPVGSVLFGPLQYLPGSHAQGDSSLSIRPQSSDSCVHTRRRYTPRFV